MYQAHLQERSVDPDGRVSLKCEPAKHVKTAVVCGLPSLPSFSPGVEGLCAVPAPHQAATSSGADEPDDLRLAATIMLKENTAPVIFRWLNSCFRQHALYQTLKAFGQIIKSLFILRCVDDLGLRQAIERQLNEVELRTSSHAPSPPGTSRDQPDREGGAGNRRSVQQADQKQHHLLEQSLRRPTDREVARRRSAGKSSQRNLQSLPNVMGARQHAREYDFSDERLRDALGILPLTPAA